MIDAITKKVDTNEHRKCCPDFNIRTAFFTKL